jgi:hypothetical protein
MAGARVPLLQLKGQAGRQLESAQRVSANRWQTATRRPVHLLCAEELPL